MRRQREATWNTSRDDAAVPEPTDPHGKKKVAPQAMLQTGRQKRLGAVRARVSDLLTTVPHSLRRNSDRVKAFAEGGCAWICAKLAILFDGLNVRLRVDSRPFLNGYRYVKRWPDVLAENSLRFHR